MTAGISSALAMDGTSPYRVTNCGFSLATSADVRTISTGALPRRKRWPARSRRGESFHLSSPSCRHHHQIHFGFLAKLEDLTSAKPLSTRVCFRTPRAIHQAFRHRAEVVPLHAASDVPVVQCKGRERIPDDQRGLDRANQPEVSSKGAGQLQRIG